jgi:hypothetical protein
LRLFRPVCKKIAMFVRCDTQASRKGQQCHVGSAGFAPDLQPPLHVDMHENPVPFRAGIDAGP